MGEPWFFDFVRALGAAVGILATLIGALVAWWKLRPKLRGTCVINKYYENPQFTKPYYAVREILESRRGPELQDVRAAMGSVPQYAELTYTENIGVLRFTNNGRKRLDNVQAKLPRAFRATVKRAGKPEEEFTFKGADLRIISLGEMYQNDSAEIEFWTRASVEDVADQTTLVHSDGAGTIVFRLPAHQFFSRLAQDYRAYLGFLLVIIGVVILTLVISRALQ
jgi:hypothetical protein